MTNEHQVETRSPEGMCDYGDEKWLEQYRSLSSWSQLGKGVNESVERESAEKRGVQDEVRSSTDVVCA